jgi:hypothetical protein
MAPVSQRLLIIDPLTLLGREILQYIEREPDLSGEISYVHTAEDDEHQIAEVGGEPALVPPLTGADDLVGCSAVLVASETEEPRMEHLVSFMESDASTPIVVAGRKGSMRDLTVPVAEPAASPPDYHVRVAHPALVATSILAGTLRDLEPVSATVAAVDPVSPLGGGAIESLARQAAQRLSGARMEDMVDNRMLAFNMIAVEDDDLNEDAAVVLPEMDISVTRSLVGRFHGHVAHIGFGFKHPLEESDLRDALLADPRVMICDTPLTADSVTDSDNVAVYSPRLSRNRRQLAVTAMVDGLRIGGANTAVEILRAMLVPTN